MFNQITDYVMLVTIPPKLVRMWRESAKINSEADGSPTAQEKEMRDMQTALVYTNYNTFTIEVARIGAYVAEMQRQKEFTDTDYCETVEVDDRGRVTMLINGRGECVAEIEY